MKLKNRKDKIASAFNVGKKRIKFDSSRLEDIKKAITKVDLRSLMAGKAIKLEKSHGQSSARSKKIKVQKSKGRRKGKGSLKGKKYSRVPSKTRWVIRVRTQRRFIKLLKDKKRIAGTTYRDVYTMVKSNRFRNTRLIKLYLEEHKLFLQDAIQKKKTK